MTALIATLLLQGNSLASEGPLAITKLTTTPANAAQWQPVKVTFELSGTWNNPFDPRQVDVTAAILGPKDSFAEMPGFLKAPGSWEVSFSPWSAGSYWIDVSVIDTVGRLDYKRFEVKVRGATAEEKLGGGFVEVKPKQRHFSRGEHGVFPVGATVTTDLNADSLMATIPTLTKGGYNALRLVLLGPALLKGLTSIDLAKAARLDSALEKARQVGLAVFLCLGSKDDFAAHWQKSPYNNANGGPCEKLEEFWTSLKGRIAYKKMLRYLIARYNSYSSFAGIEFFEGGGAPDYWLEEMAMEAYTLHPYGIPITSQSTAPFRSERMNTTAFGPDGGDAIPSAFATSAKPIIALCRNTREDMLRALALGASGVFFTTLSPLDCASVFDEDLATFDWSKRRAAPALISESNGGKAVASMDGGGGFVFVASGANAGTVSVRATRGSYKFLWVNMDGKHLAEGEAREKDGLLDIPHPVEQGPLFAIITRK